MPRLIVIMKASTPKQITLQAGQTAIGRAEQNQLTLDSPMVSRSHAVIETTGESAVVTDLGSSNGTLVNGRRVQRHVLRNRDVIEVGDVQLRFLASSDDSPELETLSLAADTDLQTGFARTLMPRR